MFFTQVTQQYMTSNAPFQFHVNHRSVAQVHSSGDYSGCKLDPVIEKYKINI